jgi:hypothetical protein
VRKKVPPWETPPVSRAKIPFGVVLGVLATRLPVKKMESEAIKRNPFIKKGPKLALEIIES